VSKNPKDELVTRGMLDQAVEAILKGVDKLFGGLKKEMNSRFDNVEGRLG